MSSNIEAYTVDVIRAAEEVERDMLSHGSWAGLLNLQHGILDDSRACVRFYDRLSVVKYPHVREAAQNPNGGLRSALQDVMGVLASVSLRDGFVFGMSANDKLLHDSSSSLSHPPTDVLADYVDEAVDEIQDTSVSAVNFSRMLKQFGDAWYISSLAHELEPQEYEINAAPNPFRPLIADACKEIYEDETAESPATRSHETSNFRRGFGIARHAYNAYRHQTTLALEASLASTIDIRDI